ncbi:hypothetical protein BC829DRAFT_413465 [Chytridium lagenaria]|nr:hypothetical protein BC829DRAFT_413465 [Chytridium lagenaria]
MKTSFFSVAFAVCCVLIAQSSYGAPVESDTSVAANAAPMMTSETQADVAGAKKMPPPPPIKKVPVPIKKVPVPVKKGSCPRQGPPKKHHKKDNNNDDDDDKKDRIRIRIGGRRRKHDRDDDDDDKFGRVLGKDDGFFGGNDDFFGGFKNRDDDFFGGGEGKFGGTDDGFGSLGASAAAVNDEDASAATYGDYAHYAGNSGHSKGDRERALDIDIRDRDRDERFGRDRSFGREFDDN